MREVYAVAAGAPVVFTNSWDHNHGHYHLDYHLSGAQAWVPHQSIHGQWIQVSQEYPKYWTHIITQGRGDHDAWVKSLKIAYTLDGKIWDDVDQGKIFQASKDRNSKVRIKFERPVYARALRIYPQDWHNNQIAMRFDAIYLDV